MPDRIPPVIREKVSPDARPYYDKFSEQADAMFSDPKPFILKRQTDGGLVGPFPFLFDQPEAGEHVMSLFGKLAVIPNLPKDAREIVILAVGAKFQAAYELYAHTNWAYKVAGLPKEIAEAVASGKRPEGMSEEYQVAYDTATYLAGTPGPLPQELWDKCTATFGRDGTVALVHYAGAYAYTCMILNAMDAPVPKDGE